MRRKQDRTLICNCCSAGFKQFPKQALLNRDRDENHCPRCFFTEEMQASLQWMSIFNDVAKAFAEPLNRFKFIHKSFEEKMTICLIMMEENIITFRIDSYN